MKALEKSGHEVYAVGGCVRDSLLGREPIDFDLATDAGLEEMTSLFPEAKVLSEKYSVLRFDYSNPSGPIWRKRGSKRKIGSGGW